MTDRILLINYDFPPALSGVRRITKMARYLPLHGFEPMALAATPHAHLPLDEQALAHDNLEELPVWRTSPCDVEAARGLLMEARKKMRILRKKMDHEAPEAPTKAKSARRATLMNPVRQTIRRLMTLPDDRWTWLATAIPMADHIMRTRAVRYVMTSSYPHSSHLIGWYLKERYNIHWHADFRDGWTQNPYFADYITPLHRRLNHWLEAQVVKHADTLTAVSGPIADHLATLTDNPRKVHLLPNGFDSTDLDGLPETPYEKFTIAYTGTMFMQRSPDSFFAALRGLLDCYPGLAENIQVLFRSNIKPEHDTMLADLGLTGVVKNLGMGSWHDALTLQKNADVLLLLEGENPNSHIMLTQKVFEYMATGKPILAVAPPGALSNLIRRTKAGVVIHPDNVFRIKETLFELFLGRMNVEPRQDVVDLYTRQNQADILAKILRGQPYAQLY